MLFMRKEGIDKEREELLAVLSQPWAHRILWIMDR